MADQLARVREAVEAKRCAEEGYRAALVSAVRNLEQQGSRSTYAAVAEAAGVSRQSVRELVQRANR